MKYRDVAAADDAMILRTVVGTCAAVILAIGGALGALAKGKGWL